MNPLDPMIERLQENGYLVVPPQITAHKKLRLFVLVRDKDDTGVSGVGLVAEGVEYSDGTVAIRWCNLHPSTPSYQRGVRPTTAVHESIESVIALHGHNGATQVIWLE